MQAKKGKSDAKGTKLSRSIVEEHLALYGSKREDEEYRWLWTEIAVTSDLIAKFLGFTKEWEALEVICQIIPNDNIMHVPGYTSDSIRSLPSLSMPT